MSYRKTPWIDVPVNKTSFNLSAHCEAKEEKGALQTQITINTMPNEVSLIQSY